MDKRKNDTNAMEEQELSSVVTLLDEDGKEVEFDHLMTFEHEGRHYLALLPLDEVEGVGDDEIVLLEVKEGDEEDLYVPIEDETLLDAVFETFQKLFDEQEDALDELDED